tara:strand:+ start:80 stop:538 length:459 start_codon:yes stop_codon:yes gene_type:complete
MDLFIKVNSSNVPQEHPAFKENLKQAFPSLDFDASTPPTGWMKFEKSSNTLLTTYEKFDNPAFTYEVIDGVVKDVWHVLNMTDEEKKEKQDKVKADWAAMDTSDVASWIFDEATCKYKAPVDPPSDAASESNPDGKYYDWDESTTSWVETGS